MSIRLHFREEDWQRITDDWSAWWAGQLDRPMVMIYGDDPRPAQGSLDNYEWFVPNLLPTMSLDEILDYYQRQLEGTRFYGDAWPKWWPNFGPGILAGFLGAQVIAAQDTVWFDPPEQTDVDNLPLVLDPANIWWRRVIELTQAAVARWQNHVSVGCTDLGGNLDILASFRTSQQLLLDLYDRPDLIKRQTEQITRQWIDCFNQLDAIIQTAGRGSTPWATIWSERRCYMLQCDFGYMISPEMFERFVLPDLHACCEVIDHAFYHLDGKGQILHLDSLLSLERLRGVQWVPGDGAQPPEQWLGLLKRIRDAGKLCQLYITAQGARTIVKELGGKGFAFHILEKMTPDQAKDFLEGLAREDARIGPRVL